MTLTVEELQNAFNAHTNVRRHKDGRVEVRCNKGLWGVSAPDERQALVEAIRYFIQYHADGEYEPCDRLIEQQPDAGKGEG